MRSFCNRCIAFGMNPAHGGSSDCIQSALFSLVFSTLCFGNAPCLGLDLQRFFCLGFNCGLIVPVTITAFGVFIKCIHRALFGAAWHSAIHMLAGAFIPSKRFMTGCGVFPMNGKSALFMLRQYGHLIWFMPIFSK